MKRLLQALALAVLVLAPTSLLAQDVLPRSLNSQEDLKLTSVGDGVVANWASVYIGPYGGAITSGDPTIPQLTLYCVDYAHDVSVGQSWHVNVSNIGGALPNLTKTYINDVVKYRQAAFLASLFSSWSDFAVGGSNVLSYTYGGSTTQFSNRAAVYSGIHAAIWRITSADQTNVFPGDFPSYGMNATLATAMSDPFYDMATSFDPTFTGIDPSFFGQWSVLSDVNGTGQEYLVRTTVTPEPETYVMLLTGLIMLFGVTWWRRRNDSASFA